MSGKHIRNSAKAIIVDNRRILVLRKNSGGEDYFVFPGGGQHKEETLAEAVKRECLEEVGAEVVVHDLLFIREYIGKNHEFAKFDSDLHQIEFLFYCTLIGSTDLSPGHEPDSGQVGIEWIPLSDVADAPVYPRVLRSHLAAMTKSGYFASPELAGRPGVGADGSPAADVADGTRAAGTARNDNREPRPPVYLGDVN